MILIKRALSHDPERKKLIISARTLIRFFLNATDPLIKAESGAGFDSIVAREKESIAAIESFRVYIVACRSTR